MVDQRVTLGLGAFWVSHLLTCLYYWVKDHHRDDLAYIKTEIKGPRPRISAHEGYKVLLVVFRNMFISAIVGALLFSVESPLPHHLGWKDWGITQWAISFSITFVLLEIIFHTVHRLLHHPKLFSHPFFNHAQHHEYDAPFALTALYCSPAEFIFVDLAGVLSGPWITNMPMLPFLLYMAIVGWDVAVGHGGHLCFRVHDSTFHDNHHRLRNVNFGVFGVLDYLRGEYFSS